MASFARWLKYNWDRGLAIAAAIAGLIAIVLGWVGISGAVLTTEQLPYLASGGVVGLFALGIAATLWLSADLRDEWVELTKIRALLEAEHRASEDRDAIADRARPLEPTSNGGQRPLTAQRTPSKR